MALYRVLMEPFGDADASSAVLNDHIIWFLMEPFPALMAN